MSNQKIVNAFDMASDYKVFICVDNIVGFPTETIELAFDTINLNRRIRAHQKSCSAFVPYHGIPLREMAIKLGYIDDVMLGCWDPEYSQLNMPQFTKKQINRVVKNFKYYMTCSDSQLGAEMTYV